MSNILYSPWRMKYIETEKSTGCIFCLPESTESDKDRLVLHRGKSCFVIMNMYPYNNGHLMVVPFKHINSLADLTDKESAEFFALVQKTVKVLQIAYNPDGINLGMNLGSAAGAGIADHIHMHIVPRWNGDVNFMTSAGGTRVIPEDFPEAYKRLKEQFDKLYE